MAEKKHIDEVQPGTVDEHLRLILQDQSVIDTKYTEVTPDDLPEWFDEKLFKLGQDYYNENLLGLAVANVTGLIATFSIPDILDVLIFTNQSNTTCTAYRRYIQTLLHIYALFNNDVTVPNSKWYKTINVIRWKHALGNKKSRQYGYNGIRQSSMALTQFGFIGYVLISADFLGLSNDQEKLKGFIHFWRVTGHMLGTDDRINLCRKTVDETRDLCREVADKIVAKYLAVASNKFIEISTHAVNGLRYADVMLIPDALIALTYKLTGEKYEKELGILTRLNIKFRETVLYLCGVPYIGVIVKGYHNYLMRLIYWTLENYPIGGWLAFGKQNANICLYPKIK